MKPPKKSELRRLAVSLRVPPGSTVRLPGDRDPGHASPGITEAQAVEALAETARLLADYQSRLAAQDEFGVAVVIQGLDASGKDGAIKNVMSGVNPAGVNVHSFKVPSAEELSHDYLWRYAQKLPRRGEIAIFNRSHYEEVLVVRVHPELLVKQHLPAAARGHDVWKRRFHEINEWERYLNDNGIKVVKIFLNLSKDEQRRRFLDRIDHPAKNWKFSAADVRERQSWDDYQAAFSEVLSNTSTAWAPWYVVPADHKWFARLAVAAIVIDELARIDPKFPTVSKETADALKAARDALVAEGPVTPPVADTKKHHGKGHGKHL